MSSKQHNSWLIDSEWLLAAGELPPLGSHVVTPRRGYSHHGIYVGAGKIIHYAGLSRDWGRGPVEEVELAGFAYGNALRVRPYSNPRFDPQEIIERARLRLGESQYQVLTTNCEHFCEWCVRGESRSRQVEALRSRPRQLLLAIFARMDQIADWLSTGGATPA